MYHQIFVSMLRKDCHLVYGTKKGLRWLLTLVREVDLPLWFLQLVADELYGVQLKVDRPSTPVDGLANSAFFQLIGACLHQLF